MSSFATDSGAVFLDLASLDRDDLDLSRLQQVAAPLSCFAQTTPEELAGRHADAWCVIANKVPLDQAFFAARPQLRLVCVVATGTNNVDLQAAAEHGVDVVNCRAYGADTVAQHVLMLILALCRSFPQYQSDVAAGRWSQAPLFCLLDHPIREIGGLKLGIVGYGDIGQRVEALAKAVGMEVLISERPGRVPRPGRMAFETLLGCCDVISLHCPLTPDTQDLIDATALQTMKKDALLINTSRGGLVNEVALMQALQEGWIAGAAVDVLSEEPPPANNVLLAAQLNNLIITPHCAWGSIEARQRIVEQTAENITAWLQGQPIRLVQG